MPLRCRLVTRACFIAFHVLGGFVVSSCGENGSDPDSTDGDTPDEDTGTPSQAARAAIAVATDDDNACARSRPFYWEIGDGEGSLVGGSVFNPDEAVIAVDTRIEVASASKWMYASYVVELRDELSEEDIRDLTHRSGYTNFSVCLARQTVGECEQFRTNGVYSADNDGLFYYGGGHMQHHATSIGLADLDRLALGDQIRSRIGEDIDLTYAFPQPAGGLAITSAEYAKFLRKIIRGDLRMRSMLGTHAVCASPSTCPDQAVSAPVPENETWHYSLGHWVEDDPVVGDGAFSSLGLFGFYPWIDRSVTWYGIIALRDIRSVLDSIECGRLIRQTWTRSSPP